MSNLQLFQMTISIVGLTLAVVKALSKRKIRDLLIVLIILVIFNLLFTIWGAVN